MQKKSRINKFISAFTLVELLVSVGIFAFMTTLMVAKYGTFNQSVLLTNLAYDVAVTIRTAQSYGLSVKGAGGGVDANKFQSGYGVYFDSHMSGATKFILYADIVENGIYDEGGDDIVEQYNLKRGAVIQYVCSNLDLSCGTAYDTYLNITFKRPDPSANICLDNSCGLSYARIIIKGTDDSTREVMVRENGQISVGQ